VDSAAGQDCVRRSGESIFESIFESILLCGDEGRIRTLGGEIAGI
jgi:hypothetical protein